MQGLSSWIWEALGKPRRKLAYALCAGIWLGLGAAPAQAQEKDELARRHFESGAAYFAEAEYEDALKAFLKAYELSNRPQILLNVSVVQERLGNLQGAVKALDEYLVQNPNDPEIETIRLRRDNLAKRVEQQENQRLAEEQTETEGQPAAAPAAAEEQPVEPAPGPPAKEPAVAQEPDRLPAYVLLSIGGLAGVGALVTGLGAQAEYDDLDTSCSPGCSDDQTSAGETLALTSTLLTGVAIVGVGVGAALWFGAEEPSPEQVNDEPRVLVGFGPEGGYAEARWAF